jgi:hypothetical protein
MQAFMSDGTISAENAAKLLMITDRHLRRLVADGWIKKTADGNYTLLGCVQGRIRHLEHQAKENSKAASQNLAHKARAEQIELQIAEKKRSLISQQEAQDVIVAIAGRVRASYAGLAAQFTRDLAQRAHAEKIVNAELQSLSRAFAAAAESLRSGKSDPASLTGYDAGSVGEDE